MRHPKRRYVFALFILILIMTVLGLLWRHSNTYNDQDISLPDYMIFMDKIVSTALDYCYQYNPDWRCTGVTLCSWPNDTATVVLYANYTIKCIGSTCYSVNGTYYRVVINTTDWSVLRFEPANGSTVQEVISECERVWKEKEQK